MTPAEIRNAALEYLYDRYLAGFSEGFVDWVEAVAVIGSARGQIGRAFEELVKAGLAEGYPGGAGGLSPEDGFVWISFLGKQTVEEQRAPAEPPDLGVILAGITDDAQSQLAALYGRIRADDREQLEQLTTELTDEHGDEESRLGTAEKLVSLVTGSHEIAAFLVAKALPASRPLIERLLNM
jgi:hypothetical protein